MCSHAASKHADAEVRLAIARLALRVQLEAGPDLARALSREWLPLTLLAACRSRRARRLGILALLADIARATAREPRAAPTNAALHLIDNAAYSAGVWRGAFAHRSARALLPQSAGTRAPNRRAITDFTASAYPVRSKCPQAARWVIWP